METMARRILLEDVEATEVFDILYPQGKALGDVRTRKAALRRLTELSKGHAPVNASITVPHSGEYVSGNLIMRWNFAQKWVALYRVTQPNTKENIESDE